jgi:NADH-quinone oxidoreductase subunit C
MSRNVVKWLNNLLQDIEGIDFKHKGDRRIRMDVAADSLPTLLELLRGRASYVHLSAISCVDWLKDDEFELVYHLWSYESNNLVSVHTRIPRTPGVYVSVYDIYHPAAFFERDIHEMYGVYFEGSPDMERFILTEWDGPPPMRKDFDAEAWVNRKFNFQDYHPDWLKDLEAQGGGVAIRPQEVRDKKRLDES